MILKTMRKNNQLVMAGLLATLMLLLAATPALAWFDEGDVAGQASTPCRVVAAGEAGYTVTCFGQARAGFRPLVQRSPLLHPAVARAEEMAIPQAAPVEVGLQESDVSNQ